MGLGLGLRVRLRVRVRVRLWVGLRGGLRARNKVSTHPYPNLNSTPTRTPNQVLRQVYPVSPEEVEDELLLTLALALAQAVAVALALAQAVAVAVALTVAVAVALTLAPTLTRPTTSWLPRSSTPPTTRPGSRRRVGYRRCFTGSSRVTATGATSPWTCSSSS